MVLIRITHMFTPIEPDLTAFPVRQKEFSPPKTLRRLLKVDYEIKPSFHSIGLVTTIPTTTLSIHGWART